MANPIYVPKVDQSIPPNAPAGGKAASDADRLASLGIGSPGDAGPGGTAPVAPGSVAGVPIVPGASGPGGTAPVEGKLLPTRFGFPFMPGPTAPLPASVQPPSPVSPVPVKTEPLPVVAQNVGSPPAADVVPAEKTFKEMIANVINSKAAPAGTNGNGFNFGDFLKAAGPKLGDFLQRWGMGLQGAPEGKTQGDIQREQAFELQKTQVQAEVAAKQMALDNQYQTQRMQLQNQMNLANLPIEAKQQLANQIAMLDAEYQNQVKLIPLQIQSMMAQRQWLPGANPADHILSQGQ